MSDDKREMTADNFTERREGEGAHAYIHRVIGFVESSAYQRGLADGAAQEREAWRLQQFNDAWTLRIQLAPPKGSTIDDMFSLQRIENLNTMKPDVIEKHLPNLLARIFSEGLRARSRKGEGDERE